MFQSWLNATDIAAASFKAGEIIGTLPAAARDPAKTRDRTYIGKRTRDRRIVVVSEGDDATFLDPRFDLRNQSPDGFNWGYAGSGPAQLALAILADALDDDQEALSLYQRFKEKVIVSLPAPGFELTHARVLEVCAEIDAEAAAARSAS